MLARTSVLAVLGLVFASGAAWAEPTAADKETARRLMAEGRTHRKADDWKGALESFLAADAIMHVPTTGLEVARAQIELGQLVEAKDKLLAVTRLPIEGEEPRAFTEARATAKILSGEIEGKIPSISVKLKGVAPGATVKVTVDDVEVPAAALVAPRAVDPGHHVVRARARGGEPVEEAVDVAASETKEISLDVPPGQAGAEEGAPPGSESAGATDGSSKWRVVTWVGFGVGGAGLVAGSITGLLAISDFNAAKQQGCVNNQCPPSAYPGLDKAGTMATISTIGFVAAGVGVGAGVLGLILGKRPPAAASPAADSATVTADVYFGPGSAGVRGSF